MNINIKQFLNDNKKIEGEKITINNTDYYYSIIKMNKSNIELILENDFFNKAINYNILDNEINIENECKYLVNR